MTSITYRHLIGQLSRLDVIAYNLNTFGIQILNVVLFHILLYLIFREGEIYHLIREIKDLEGATGDPIYLLVKYI